MPARPQRQANSRKVSVLSRNIIALSLACMCGLLSACSKSGSPASTSKSTSKAYKVGILQFASSDPYSSSILTGIQKYAQDQGWHASVVDSGGDVSKALTVMSNFVQQKVDVIVTATYPPAQLQGAIAQAKAAQIPVVSVIGAGDIRGLVAYYQLGKPQGAAIMTQMEKDLSGKKVNLLEITYSPGTGCQEEGAELSAWKASTKAQIIKDAKNEVPIPGQVEAARSIAAEWLQSSPASNGVQNVVWACWDDPALGVVAALRAANRKDVLLYGATGEKGAILAIKDGWMMADVYTDPNAVALTVGKDLPRLIKGGVNVKTEAFAAPTVPVTRNNVADFIKQYPDAVK